MKAQGTVKRPTEAKITSSKKWKMLAEAAAEEFKQLKRKYTYFTPHKGEPQIKKWAEKWRNFFGNPWTKKLIFII